MNKKSLLSLFLAATLGVSSSLHAEIGVLSDAIQAAEDRIEPVYIAELMDQFSIKLLNFAKEKKIGSKREKLALLITMNLFFSATNKAVASVSSERRRADPLARYVGDTAERSGLNQTWETMKLALRSSNRETNRAENEAFRVGFKALWKTAGIFALADGRETVWESSPRLLELDMKPKNSGPIVYRVAEWRVLNYFVDYGEVILSATYRAVLGNLREDSRASLFESPEAWLEFERLYFSSANEVSFRFLAPWLRIFDSMMFCPSLFQFQLCHIRDESPVSMLPKELVYMISNYVAPSPWGVP